MFRGVERAPLESRKAIRRATATDEVCTLPAALVGAVATFVLAVTQPASDDANATSANPVEIRRVAVTRSFDIRNPPGRISANLRIPNHASNEVDHGNTRANKAGAVRVVAIFLSVANEKQFALGVSIATVAGEDDGTTPASAGDAYSPTTLPRRPNMARAMPRLRSRFCPEMRRQASTRPSFRLGRRAIIAAPPAVSRDRQTAWCRDRHRSRPRRARRSGIHVG